MFRRMDNTTKTNTMLTYCLSIGSLGLIIYQLHSSVDVPFMALNYSVFFLSTVNLVINLNLAIMEMPEKEGIRKWDLK